ncbi:hypothetical protein DYB31_008073 [Aphanomyces astaci]|uniref:Protein kinase domain-containing protein n=1 Tax=Aphanomyces astaci TaxID=112090 RepID=A0A397FEC5_APHAT|nr:hypothetical protein DYB31_008073 [Aphanomyces astaci]
MASNHSDPNDGLATTTTLRPLPVLTRPIESDANAALPLGLAAGIAVLGTIAYFLHRRRSKERRHRETMLLEQQAATHQARSAPLPAAAASSSVRRGGEYAKMAEGTSPPRAGGKSASKQAKASSSQRNVRLAAGHEWTTHPALTGLWLPPGTEHMTMTPVRGCSNAVTGTLDDGTKLMLKRLQLESAQLPAFVAAVGDVRRVAAHESINGILGVVLSHGALNVAAPFMAKGSLGPLLVDSARQAVPPSVRKSIALQVAKGLAHLHHSRTPFGSLHSGNVLVSSASPSQVVVKLNGFALLHRPLSSGTAPVETFGNFCTSYKAPEWLNQSTRAPSLASDVFSLGVLLGEIFTRTHPHAALFHTKGFVGGDLHLLQLAQQNKQLPFPYDVAALEAQTSAAFVDVMTRCVHMDPAKRPSANDVVARLEALEILQNQASDTV